MTPTNHVSTVHAHPTHPKPLLPSVLRQLALAGITDTKDIKGTGYKGMLTKGDVLAFLGKIGNPHGSIKKENLRHKHPALVYAASPKDVRRSSLMNVTQLNDRTNPGSRRPNLQCKFSSMAPNFGV